MEDSGRDKRERGSVQRAQRRRETSVRLVRMARRMRQSARRRARECAKRGDFCCFFFVGAMGPYFNYFFFQWGTHQFVWSTRAQVHAPEVFFFRRGVCSLAAMVTELQSELPTKGSSSNGSGRRREGATIDEQKRTSNRRELFFLSTSTSSYGNTLAHSLSSELQTLQFRQLLTVFGQARLRTVRSSELRKTHGEAWNE